VLQMTGGSVADDRLQGTVLAENSNPQDAGG
jgi:hypothetical protein